MESSDSLNSSTPLSTINKGPIPSGIAIASVIANVHPCSYLPDKLANLPLALPRQKVTPEQLDSLLESGMRRAGIFLYHTACSHCSACEPSRVDVNQFEWSDSWRRIRNRGDKVLEVALTPASSTPEKLSLFNAHREARGLASDDTMYGLDDYESFLVESCCEHTLEMQFRLHGELVAVSVIDCAKNSVSAVYTYFNPLHSKLSLGTYAILKQIDFCKQTQRQFVYLGMYVAANRHLNYKGRFRPQQRWIQRNWVDIHSE